MKRSLIIILLVFQIQGNCFAGNTFTDSSMGFQIDFPCTPQKNGRTIENYIINVYNCEASIGGDTFYYSIHLTAQKDNAHIRYKQKDIDAALKNFVTGGLVILGISAEDIVFQKHTKFQGRYPAVYYYSMRNNIVAEGLSCLIKGKHFRIGMMYKKTSESKAKIQLKSFLNSYKLY